MWKETSPNEGDTVMVSFGDFTNKGKRIGVLLRYNDKGAVINFGNTLAILDRLTTFLVWENKNLVI